MIEEIYIPPVTQCCCAWTDLLGFSELYKKYKWSLSALVKDYKKLGTPYVKGYVHFDRLYKMLIMTYHTIDPIIEKAIFINDGFARNVDVCGPVTHPFPLLSWFRETIFKHEHYCSHGHQSDFPGVRTVVTFGERTDFGFDTANVSDYAGKEIKNDEIVIYSPRHFQNNLAFAKAYLIETTVSKCRNWKVQSDYFIERDFIYFLIEHLDGKYFIVDNYYEFSDRESKEAILKDEPIKILFQVQFQNDKLKVKGKIEKRWRTFINLALSSPILINKQGLLTEVYELVKWKNLLLEDYRGRICEKG